MRHAVAAALALALMTWRGAVGHTGYSDAAGTARTPGRPGSAVRLTGRASSGPLTVRSAGWVLEVSRATGAVTAIRSADGRAVCGAPPGAPAWRLHFRDGARLASTDAAAGPVRIARAPDGALRVTQTGTRATVRTDLAPRPDGFEMRLTLVRPAADVTFLESPAELAARPGALKRVIVPSDLGIALKPAFFRAQAHPGTWTERDAGPGPLRDVAGFECRVVAPERAQAPLSVTPEGARILGEPLARTWSSAPRPVSRPSNAAPDLELLSSPNGAYLAGHRVGHGMLVRFAGPVLYADAAVATATARRVLCALKTAQAAGFTPLTGRRRVVLLRLRHGPVTGGWCQVRIDAWQAALEGQSEMRKAGLDLRVVETVEAMARALHAPDTFAVVNPYGEALPTGEADARPVWSALADYLRAGGVWLATGGWPLFMELRSSPYLALEANRSVQFADFVRFEAAGGSVSVFSVQPYGRAVYAPTEIRAFGSPLGACVSRKWTTFVPRGSAWTTPPTRMTVNTDGRAALRAYARANGLTRPLAAKMRPDVLERWRNSVLINYEAPTFAEQVRYLDLLPAPAWLSFANHLPAGFDRYYPDHLPPRPQVGTLDELRGLLGRIRDTGRLAAPYTNVTWWCDEPRGPTFARVGEGPLLRDLAGRRVREAYGANVGWAVSPWRSEVLAASDRVRDELARDLGAETLFQDQIGARTWLRHDPDAAAPAPHAYLEGLVRLSKRTADVVPVSTEHGFDRLINVQSQFRGLTWSLVPAANPPGWMSTWQAYRDFMAPEAWEFYPLAQFIAAGCVAFGHHGGWPMVSDRTVLTWSTALGFQLSTAAWAPWLAHAPARQWLLYLDRVQKSICARYFDQPMLSCRYLKGSGDRGVIESRWPGLRVVANLTAAPYRLGDVEVAPQGFWAAAADAEAGIVRAYRGHRYGAADLWLVRDGRGRREQVWAYTDRTVTVPTGSGPVTLSPSGAEHELVTVTVPEH